MLELKNTQYNKQEIKQKMQKVKNFNITTYKIYL